MTLNLEVISVKKFLYSATLLLSIALMVAFAVSEEIPDSQEESVTTETMIPLVVLQTHNLERETVTYEKLEPEKETTTTYARQFSTEDEFLLAKIAMAEAEGESTEVKALVILTVLNRVDSPSFPDTIESVLFQRTSNGGYQFSPVCEGGRWYTTEPIDDCYEALELVKSGWDESQGALYFESAEDPTWHSRNLHFLFKNGRMKFYREKGNDNE